MILRKIPLPVQRTSSRNAPLTHNRRQQAEAEVELQRRRSRESPVHRRRCLALDQVAWARMRRNRLRGEPELVFSRRRLPIDPVCLLSSSP